MRPAPCDATAPAPQGRNGAHHSFFAEIQRRHVLRAGAFYAASAWLLVQVATQVFPFFHISEWVVRWIVVGSALGLPLVLVLAWFYEWTPHGLARDSGGVDELPPLRRRRFDRWVAVLLAVIVVLLLTDRVVTRRDAAAAVAPGPAAAAKR